MRFTTLDGGTTRGGGLGRRTGLLGPQKLDDGTKQHDPLPAGDHDPPHDPPEADLPVSARRGLDNPLGACALYLNQGGRDILFRIHGTNEPWSIGEQLSSGCVRMLNEDVLDLYDRVPVGTTVLVRRNGRWRV